MSIFGKIMSTIFGSSTSAASTGSAAAPADSGATTGAAGGGTMSEVDVEKVVSEMAAKKKEKLDWKKSIVDLMKVLDLDSSLKARQELAKELKYTGDMNDSAKMNIWLHKHVMKKLAENGGKVPADLKD
ncbi:DUF3597 domain-containing protein [Pseudorhodoplanes sinuspersici]|uniref:Uncharacterized protein n=1 Tax=Pseudorhodoplanes sinuspersici TaxID=1235591 RepID=A0A1W6ZXY7_9HYPH|nr:DUF3597 domain-containing protein [Pseudorhodoplanes sinuspersici]ARQ02011.1 hypothetical protein CAK95_25100 [Pseudorhodoplanes sinuspersici]RKE73793.1 uncharacterized protein DUF3597 [Pseudorhodoplanes sinuspersici]